MTPPFPPLLGKGGDTPPRRASWRLGGLVLVGALGLGGCGATSGAVPRRNAPDTVVVRSQQEPDRLNPTLTNSIAAVDVCTPMFNGLVGVDDRMQYYPDLLTVVPTLDNHGVELEGDGMRVTYHLRPGVTFHDGVPLTSHDVWFNWKLHMDPRALVSSRDGYDQITRIDTPDPTTAIVHFRRPYAPYLGLFALPGDPILPAHRLEHSQDVNLDGFNRAPVGTGPFRFRRWVSGDYVELEAFPAHFRGAPRLRKLYFKFIPDDNAAYLQLANGDVDVAADLNLNQLPAARLLPHVAIANVPSLTFEQISFNLERSLGKERSVRQALAQAIDKRELAHRVFKNVWPVAHTSEHPLSWAYNPRLREPYPYNPPRARALLEAAGWKLGPDGIRTRRGTRLSFTLTSTAGRKIREQTELVLVGYFKAIGVELKLKNVEGGLLFAGYPSGLLQGGKYDLALFAWTASVDPSGNFGLWHSRQVPPEGGNTTRFRHPEMDRVLEIGNRELRPAARQSAYWRMGDLLQAELPILPLVYWTELHGVNRALQGFRAHPTSCRFVWNVKEWSLRP